jgi:hypothetical protein
VFSKYCYLQNKRVPFSTDASLAYRACLIPVFAWEKLHKTCCWLCWSSKIPGLKKQKARGAKKTRCELYNHNCAVLVILDFELRARTMVPTYGSYPCPNDDIICPLLFFPSHSSDRENLYIHTHQKIIRFTFSFSATVMDVQRNIQMRSVARVEAEVELMKYEIPRAQLMYSWS